MSEPAFGVVVVIWTSSTYVNDVEALVVSLSLSVNRTGPLLDDAGATQEMSSSERKRDGDVNPPNTQVKPDEKPRPCTKISTPPDTGALSGIKSDI